MVALSKALALSAFALRANAWEPPRCLMMEYDDWAFNVWFERFHTRDCASENEMIGERESFEQNECKSWDNHIPFKGFIHYVSLATA